jgi:2',3'-cyclic-nucleotide 2'-phosphodiesterase (5'-nucleotidase family)
MKRSVAFRASLFLFAVSALFGTLVAQPRTLTILHTNDMHAAFVPREAVWVKTQPRPMVGGFTELAYTVDSIRHTRSDVLLLDGGDVMTGNPITERVYKGASGGTLFEMMNMIGYDAWCPGNHDLDVSQANLIALASIAKFPTLCANLVNDQHQFPLHNIPYTIIKRNGLRVGIIGIISQELYSLVLQANLTGLRVLSPQETTQKYVDLLRPKTDLVIALTHQGVDEDSALAASVHGLDMIVGAHSHTRLKVPRVVNGVYIVQTGSNIENLGVVSLTVDNHRLTNVNGRLIQLWAAKKRPTSPVSTLVDSMQAEIEKEYSEVIGVLHGDWVRGGSESAIGSYITEAQREAARADVGFMNIHGIRKDLLAGPIRKKDLFEALPFRNVLATFQLTGTQLRTVLEYAVRTRSPIHLAGITATWLLGSDSTVELRDVRINGNVLDDKRAYSCVASDYLMGEAERYLGIVPTDIIYLPLTLFGTVEKRIREDHDITPKVIPALHRAQ